MYLRRYFLLVLVLLVPGSCTTKSGGSSWIPVGEAEGTVSWTIALPIREGAQEKVKRGKRGKKNNFITTKKVWCVRACVRA